MKAGFAGVTITPPAGTRMSGYRLRREPAAGVHDDLYARCALLDHGGEKLALVALDLIGLDYTHAEALKQAIREACGLPPERTLLSCTHTHSGPDTLRLHGNDAVLERYCGRLYEAVARCVNRAQDSVESATLSLARCQVPGVAFNRRIVLSDGSACLNLEPIEESRIAGRGPVDPQAAILVFSGKRGYLGAVANFSLHATVLDQENLLFTRDWPGYLVDSLERDLPGNPTVLYCNGAFGNINQIESPGIWTSSFREAERIGGEIASKLIVALETRTTIPASDFSVQHGWLELSRRPGRSPERIDAEILDAETELRGMGAPAGEKRPALEKELIFLYEERELVRDPRNEQVEIQRITLGEVEIIGLPGEIFVEYGLELKKTSPLPYCLIFGNANGSAGYVPLPESFAKGAYETRLSGGSRLTEQAGLLILQSVETMRAETLGRKI